MICDDLKKSLKDLQDNINKLNAGEITVRYELGQGKTPEDVKDMLVHKMGVPPDAASSLVESPTGWHPDMLKQMGETNEMADKAMSFQSQAQSPKESVPNKEFVKQQATGFRNKLVEALDRSFNSLPRGMTDNLSRMLKRFATFRDVIDVGGGVLAGRNARRLIDNEVMNLHKSSGSKLKYEDFKIGLEGLARTREEGMTVDQIPSKIKEIKARIDKLQSEGKTMLGDVSLKELKHMADVSQEIVDLPGVKDYVKETYRKLDVVHDKYFQGNGRSGYYHNHRIVQPYMDIWDSIFYGDRRSKSSFLGEKQFKNGWDAEFAGFRSSTHDFVEANGMYYSSLGNRVRQEILAKEMRANAGLNNAHPDKMMIQTSLDHAEPAFAVRPEDGKDWEIPKTDYGERYREMNNLGSGKDFQGIYVHPEVYKWQERVYRHIKPDGLAAGALKGMRMWKTIVLSGASFIHAGSLAKKYFYLASRFKMTEGVNNGIPLFSSYARGLETLDMKSKDFPTTLKFMQNGLSLETYDMSRNALFDRKYDIKTGDQTMLSNLSEGIRNFTDWTHKQLFEKFRTGLKLNLAHQIAKSDYFKNLVKDKYHGDVDGAYAEVATMLNDHFGGQNLELIGRSRLVQSIMQASLLSPEWTEAKFRRAYGAIMNPSKEIRTSYRLSMAAELGTVVALKLATQGVYNAMNPNDQRTMKQMAEDAWNRKLASLYIGKVGDKEIFVNFGQSENQDWALFLPMAKGIYDSYSQGDPKQLPAEIAQEMSHKLSPPVKGVIEMMQPKTQRQKEIEQKQWNKKNLIQKAGSLAAPFTPIAAQQLGEAAEGTYGEPRALKVLESVGLNIAGSPMQAYSAKKEKKESKAKTMGLKK